jgi:sulfoxide reductase catalytic subunit YedY
MQVPWVGFPLRKLIEKAEPKAEAKYLRFVSLLDHARYPRQKTATWYPWPYYEGLRMDEAMNALAMVVVGVYGKELPPQNGSPIRIITPWKYGYKSPKAITTIEFTDEQPGTFWNDLQSKEYSFLSNVEPHVPHPRWSQEYETDIGTNERRKTLPYNGYAEHVAALYA